MPKRLSEIQWQGITGEKAFELWAVKNRVLPTKLDPDQGIDYVCQVVGSKTQKASFETPGQLMAVAVRSSDKAEIKVKLDRNDAELLLRLNLPTALAILDLRSEGDFPDVYFRFLDGAFIRELFAFLKGSKKTKQLKASTCVSGPHTIRSAIEKAFLPGAYEKIQALKRKLKLQVVIKDALLTVISTGTSSYSLVRTLNFFDQYDTGKPDVQAAVEAAVFGRQEFFADRLRSLPFRDGLLDVLKELPHPIVIGGIASEEYGYEEVSAIGAGDTATCEFALKKHGIWMAYCHESGITLKVSEAVKREGQWVHLTEDFVDHETQVRELLTGGIGTFLKCAREEADISFGRRLTLPAKHFPSLNPLGWLCVYLHQLGDQEWLDLADWRADKVEEEDLQSLRFLASLGETPGMLGGFGFLVGGFHSEEVKRENCRFTVPICMNLRGEGVVCWLSTTGTLFLEPTDGRCVGLRLGPQSTVRIAAAEHPFPTNGLPKVKIFSGWPAIALHRIEQEFVSGDDQDWGVELQFMEK